MTSSTSTYDHLGAPLKELVRECVSDAIRFINECLHEDPSGNVSIDTVVTQSETMLVTLLDPTCGNAVIGDTLRKAIGEYVRYKVGFGIVR